MAPLIFLNSDNGVTWVVNPAFWRRRSVSGLRGEEKRQRSPRPRVLSAHGEAWALLGGVAE
jgi:hypothetical protein